MQQRPWWGDYSFADGEARSWLLGPLSLWIQHGTREWRIGTEHADDPLLERLEIFVPQAARTEAIANTQRHAFRRTQNTLQLLPALADRSMVALPSEPFSLTPREETTLYVSTVLWWQAWADKTLLQEGPIYRPSDTWFGPNTQRGELCYASRTRARTGLSDLPHRPYRAISEVAIRNRAETPLRLDRLKIPVRHLTLFASEDGLLWTEQLTLERKEDGNLAAMQLSRSPSSEIGRTTLVRGPRERPARGLLVEAFGGLFFRRAGE